MSQRIQVSLDGGVTFIDAPSGVIVHHQGVPVVIDGEDGEGEIHISHTSEGVITDAWGTRADPLDTHPAPSRATTKASSIPSLASWTEYGVCHPSSHG
jgi:hypothetical protein